MTLWRSKAYEGPVGIEMQHPPHEPPADVRAGVLEVDRLTAEALAEQAGLFAEDRDARLVDLAIDVRRALGLPMPGTSAPVIPGRES